MHLGPDPNGWKLGEIGEDPAEVSGILLRWVASQDLVDHVIVSMRKSEWVRANLDAVARGPLTEEEQFRLEGWHALAESFGISCSGHRRLSARIRG